MNVFQYVAWSVTGSIRAANILCLFKSLCVLKNNKQKIQGWQKIYGMATFKKSIVSENWANKSLNFRSLEFRHLLGVHCIFVVQDCSLDGNGSASCILASNYVSENKSCPVLLVIFTESYWSNFIYWNFS